MEFREEISIMGESLLRFYTDSDDVLDVTVEVRRVSDTV